MNGGGVLGVDGLWDPQKMLTVQWERDLSQFSCSTKDKTEGFGLREQREQKRSAGGLPDHYKIYFSFTFRSGQQYSTEVFIQIRIYKLKMHEVIGKPKDKEVLLSSVP